jgi:hypothetical protein
VKALENQRWRKAEFTVKCVDDGRDHRRPVPRRAANVPIPR